MFKHSQSTLHDHQQLGLNPLHICCNFSLTAHSEGLPYHCGCAAGSPACWQRSLSLPARPVCDWWRSALTAGWSPPGWLTEWPHRCAGPAACCHPSFSRLLPEGEKEIQTRCHADKLTISSRGRCPQIKSSSFSSLTSSQILSLTVGGKGNLNPHRNVSFSLKDVSC